ncbi:Lacal_2735 family protein [Bernardetia sp.]|uniref:Lacal_2735 family protein n=1 Tax=Bernardetia sp. TaxID=1937974 RepID=UPI0025C1E8C2|nr:Lacal_2735 family protein [Bernardetia sp.]
MFGLFKKKDPIQDKIDKLTAKYKKITEEAFNLSRSDRKASDLKTAEAEEILKEIEELRTS